MKQWSDKYTSKIQHYKKCAFDSSSKMTTLLKLTHEKLEKYICCGWFKSERVKRREASLSRMLPNLHLCQKTTAMLILKKWQNESKNKYLLAQTQSLHSKDNLHTLKYYQFLCFLKKSLQCTMCVPLALISNPHDDRFDICISLFIKSTTVVHWSSNWALVVYNFYGISTCTYFSDLYKLPTKFQT